MTITINGNPSPLDMVAEFHQLFEHPIKPSTEGDEPLNIRQLRIKLLFEELSELVVASDCRETMFDLCARFIDKNNTKLCVDGDNVDKVEELDALCDIQYVLLGKVLTGGYHKVFDAAFKVVHANNMTKAHSDVAHAYGTIDKLGLQIDSFKIENKNEQGVLLFNSDGKLTKPHDHKKVSLEPFITGTVDMTDLLPREGMNTEEATKLVSQLKDKIEPYRVMLDEDEVAHRVNNSPTEEYTPQPIDVVRDNIVNVLKNNGYMLCIGPSKPNYQWEQFANPFVTDDTLTSAVSIIKIDKPRGQSLPISVFTEAL